MGGFWQGRKLRKTHRLRRETHPATGVLAALRTQRNDDGQPLLLPFTLTFLKNLIDPGVVGCSVNFSLAVAKNQHRQPLGILHDLIQQRLQCVKVRFF